LYSEVNSVHKGGVLPGRLSLLAQPEVKENHMTVMTTWNGFEDLRAMQEEIAQMNKGWAWRGGHQYDGATGRPGWSPPVDISEGEDAYLIAAELPGVSAGEVEITSEDGLLTIQGERHQESAADGQKACRGERRYGPFRRSFILPAHVDADNIEASAQDGVLKIRVPKAKDMRSRRIDVHAGHRQAVASAGNAAQNGN
jgi:HSP20 family protein